MNIKLESLIKINPYADYKIHFAVWNGEMEPLDVFARDREEWKGWNGWRGNRDVFKRKYIFSLIRFYHKTDKWLFGGIFEVKFRGKDSNRVELCEQYQEFIGRLIIHYPGPGVRGRAFNSENHYGKLIVSEILDTPYSGEVFCGCDKVSHGFSQLESIFEQNKPDWKAGLENVKGVYLITDKKNGKMYVGSAYGESGIWSRWSCYLGTGHYKGSMHGGNRELQRLIKEKGQKYARKHFLFSILEHLPQKTEDKVVIDREQHWKQVLLSGPFGYNKN